MPARPPLNRTPPAQRRPNFDDFFNGSDKVDQKNGSKNNGGKKMVRKLWKKCEKNDDNDDDDNNDKFLDSS